ncbi:hypothetical protein Bca52824_002092 [Brassica carinata]|uniref:Uncharacterized protein n=1 Tax=Brassica carinata TaxID=52824 RepID=A0A8X8BEI8_BRACI|nr:hypothetical protein Bca52824_002092 [Brassica carinata]
MKTADVPPAIQLGKQDVVAIRGSEEEKNDLAKEIGKPNTVSEQRREAMKKSSKVQVRRFWLFLSSIV